MEFIKALPVWLEGKEREMNVTCALFTSFALPAGRAVLRVTGCSLYRAFLNGKLVAYGPARAPHHHFRIDEWELTDACLPCGNSLYIETAGYNVNSFYTLDQPSFVQAELVLNGTVAAATGYEGFTAREVTERVQRVPKYSFQRPFTEAWRLSPCYPASYFKAAETPAKLAVQPTVKYLSRNVLYPEFHEVYPVMIAGSGSASDGHKRESYRRDRAVANISPVLKGYPLSELDVNLNDLAQEFDYVPDETPAPLARETLLEAGRYAVFGYDRACTGFPSFTVRCEKEMTLWLIWDEILRNGDVEFNRHIECVNALRLELKPGRYNFTGFECYVFMGMKFIALGGSCVLSNVHLTEYVCPLPLRKECPVDDPEIKAIYDAAVRGYSACCLESFMDDPSRERNDCLFDSYFMAHAEKLLTGGTAVEHNMMEAYRLADDKDFLPLDPGELPTMYPGDHYDRFYAPTHQMWLTIQLSEYVHRSGDTEMGEGLKDRMYKSYRYFEKFRNADGLLENLRGWVFVDWGRSNNIATGTNVSYAGNMIYAGMLDALFDLYGDPVFAEEAAAIRRTIREKSFTDGFFHDIAVRGEDGLLHNTEDTTEACQTYAFWFGCADGSDRELLGKLLTGDPGMVPQHALTQPIRMKVILQYLGKDAFLSELKKCFSHQVHSTGSLWEDDDPDHNLIEAIHSEYLPLIESLK